MSGSGTRGSAGGIVLIIVTSLIGLGAIGVAVIGVRLLLNG